MIVWKFHPFALISHSIGSFEVISLTVNGKLKRMIKLWEQLHNQDFNRVQFEAVKNEAGLNRFVMTPSKWIDQMNSVGIVSKSGRYGGGTYA